MSTPPAVPTALPLLTPLHGFKAQPEVDSEGGYFPLYRATICECCGTLSQPGTVRCETCIADDLGCVGELRAALLTTRGLACALGALN